MLGVTQPMSTNRLTTVAVIFGGRSVEHDVSVVTGNQIIRALDPKRYQAIPVYINRDGNWYSGEPLLELDNYKDEITSYKGVYQVVLSPSTRHHGLIVNPLVGRFQKNELKRVDIVFPAIHGSHGEDGTLQGLFELADVPYVGCGVLASAVSNDKAITKQVLRQNNVPVVSDIVIYRSEWLDNPEAIIERIKQELGFPVFVKPVTLGSSIGVGRADNDVILRASIDVAANFDRRIMIEGAITNGKEINCSVMGIDDKLQASVLEQPVSWDEFLTYEEKYMRGDEGMKSAERIIPAPISDEMTTEIQNLAKSAFKAVDGRGIARIDFLIDENDQIYLNEINTLPGSLSFYLWNENGMSSSEVVDHLIKLARDAHAEKRRSSFDYQTDLINLTASRGLKGLKGSKANR